MKKYIALFTMLTVVSFTQLFAQKYYYYYNGEKIFLEINPNKASVIFPKGNFPKEIKSMYILEDTIKVISDDAFYIKVVNFVDTENEKNIELLKSDLQNNINKDVIVLPAYKNSRGNELIMTNYLNVRLKTDKDIDKLYSIAEKYNLEIVRKSELMPLWYTLNITPKTQETTLNVANAIFETGLFASSFADFSYDGRECILDPNFSQQWGLQNNTYQNIDISACSAWKYSTGKGVKIAIVDEGIEKTHSDLVSNIYNLSYDTETHTSPSGVYGSHGTHCAGIAAAAVNGILVAGVAPDAKLMAVSNSLGGPNYERNIAEGIAWAWKNGADIISCSWWCNESDYIKEAIDSLLLYGRNGKGAIFVKSAGNQYGGTVTFPGGYRPEVLAVSSIDINGEWSYFSSLGNPVDVCAPGNNIYSTLLNNTIGLNSGTSMACPHVSGVAALILEVNPALTGQEVRDIIEQNTKKVGSVGYHNNNPERTNGTWNNKHGYGLIDAYAAVRAACPTPVINFFNQIVTTNTTVTNNCGDINVQNVTVKNGAKLILDAAGEVNIISDFEVELGSEFEIVYP